MSKQTPRELISPMVSPAGISSYSYVDSTVIDYVKTIHLTFHDQLRTADQKVAYVFTFVVAILVFWSSGLKKGFAMAAPSDLISLRWFLTFCFAGALCYTIACIALVIRPRVRPSRVALFWGTWPAAADAVRNIPEFMASHFVFDEYIENIDNLAAICQHKFRYVGFAYRGLGAMILLHLSILTFG
jgi:Family of unknown function (DUF5706)